MTHMTEILSFMTRRVPSMTREEVHMEGSKTLYAKVTDNYDGKKYEIRINEVEK